MNERSSDSVEIDKKARQAVYIWIAFFVATVLINGTILYAIGIDTYAWTYSTLKGLLLFTVDYAGFFLVVPLILTKGWKTIRKPSFLLPMAAAAVSVVLWYPIHYIATIAIVVYIYLHWRFDLSELGFRTRGWKGDILAILLFGSLGLLQALLSGGGFSGLSLPRLRIYSLPHVRQSCINCGESLLFWFPDRTHWETI